MPYCKEYQHLENRQTSTIKISHSELLISFCHERFAFAVSELLLS